MPRLITRTRIVAGAPLEAGGRRFLPSIRVTTLESNPGGGIFQITRLQPVSVVEEYAGKKYWHDIPDATQKALRQIAVFALAVALISSFILLLQRLTQAE